MTTPPAAPLAARIRDTFLAPRRLAHTLEARPAWRAPLLLALAVAMLAVLMVPDEVFVAMTENAVDRRGRPVDVTAAPALIGRYGRFMAMFTVATQYPLLALGGAALLYLVFTRLARGTAPVRQYFALLAHVLLIPALGTLLLLGLVAAGVGRSEPSLLWLLPWLSAESGAGRVLALLNPFTLWAAAATGIGVAALNRRRAALPVGLLLATYLATAALVAAVTG